MHRSNRFTVNKYAEVVLGDCLCGNQGPCYFSDYRLTFISRCSQACENATGARERGGIKGRSGSLRGFHNKCAGQRGSIAALGLRDDDACFDALGGRGRGQKQARIGLGISTWARLTTDTLRGSTGAGDGNRTRTASLEGWDSTIELHPHRPGN